MCLFELLCLGVCVCFGGCALFCFGVCWSKCVLLSVDVCVCVRVYVCVLLCSVFICIGVCVFLFSVIFFMNSYRASSISCCSCHFLTNECKPSGQNEVKTLCRTHTNRDE